jgi:hypothetical protein
MQQHILQALGNTGISLNTSAVLRLRAQLLHDSNTDQTYNSQQALCQHRFHPPRLTPLNALSKTKSSALT